MAAFRIIGLTVAALVLFFAPQMDAQDRKKPAKKQTEMKLKVGDAAPDFEMEATDGKTYTLKDFKGKKPLVIAWFPKAFTGGCTKQCKSYRDNSEKIREFDAAYFTASVDTVEKNKAFAKELMLDFPILCDPELKAAKAFGVLNSRNLASRITFYIDKEGNIAHIDLKVDAAIDGETAVKQMGLLKFEKKATTVKGE